MVNRARANDKIELLTPYVGRRGARRHVRHRRAAAPRRDGRDARDRGAAASSSRSATTRTRSSSSTSSTTTRTATCSRSRARPRRTSRACSRSATCRITSTARRSPPPARAVWARSTPSGTWRSSRATRARRSPRRGPRPSRARKPRGRSERRAAGRQPRRVAGDAGSTCSTRRRTSFASTSRRHPSAGALELLLAPLVARRRAAAADRVATATYVFGVLLVAVAVPRRGRVFYQEVDFVLTPDELVTVRRRRPDEHPFDPTSGKERVPPGRAGRACTSTASSTRSPSATST